MNTLASNKNTLIFVNADNFTVILSFIILCFAVSF